MHGRTGVRVTEGQVVVPGAEHFFEGKEDLLVQTIDAFLGRVLR